MRHLLEYALITSLCFPILGCGGGDKNFVVSGTVPSENQGVTQARTGVRGSFAINAAEAGAPLTVYGTVATSLESRNLLVELIAGAGGPQVRATLPDGQQLVSDVLIRDGKAEWVWVTPVTHLVSAYRVGHPQSFDQAAVRVKAFLGLAADDTVTRPFSSSARSRFSPQAFFAAAQSAGGIEALTQGLVGAIENGDQRSFLEAHPLAGGISLRAGGTGVRAQEGEIVAEVAEKSIMKQLAGQAAKGAASGGTKKLLGWVAGLCGLSSSTDKELDAMSKQLDNISDQITALSDDAQKAAALSLGLSLSDETANLETLLSDEKNTVALSFTSGYQPGQPDSNTNFLAPFIAGLDNFVAKQAGLSIIDACLNNGLGNLITANNEAVGLEYGSGVLGTQPQAFFYDFRKDSVSVSLQNAASYYDNYLGLAANALSEQSHYALTQSGSNPANSLTLPQLDLNGSSLVPNNSQKPNGGADQLGWMAMSNRIKQQAPLALFGGSSPLDGLYSLSTGITGDSGGASGHLFTWAVSEIAQDGKDSKISIDATLNYSVNGLSNWTIPSLREVQYLCQVANSVAVADNKTGSNKIPYGLHKLGILSDHNYTTDMDEVLFYCNHYVTNSSDPNKQTLQVYSSSDFDSSDPTGSSAGGNGVYYNGSSYQFRPQGSDQVALVVLNLSLPNFVPAPSQVPVPEEVRRAAGLPGSALGLSSALPLAVGMHPAGIAISQSPTDPYQLQALAYWPWGGGTTTYWYDVTNEVEWLSSDTSRAEVSNFEWVRGSDSQGKAGVINLHKNDGPVTFTATLLTTPKASTPTNSVAADSKWIQGSYAIEAGFNPEAPGQTFIPALAELMVTPGNFTTSRLADHQFHATGRFNDLRFVNMDLAVAWSIQGNPTGLEIDATGKLKMLQGYQPSGQIVTVIATPAATQKVVDGPVLGTATIKTNP